MSEVVEVRRDNVPAHVPRHLVVDFDLYDPPGAGEDFQSSWKQLQESAAGDLVWTTANGGHWIAVRGKVIFRNIRRLRALLVELHNRAA